MVLGEIDGKGTYQLDTLAGEVPVTVRLRDGMPEASLTSVEPTYTVASEALVSAALAALDWSADELDGSLRWHCCIWQCCPD